MTTNFEIKNPQETATSLRNIQYSLNMLMAIALEHGTNGESAGLNPAISDLVALNSLTEILEEN